MRHKVLAQGKLESASPALQDFKGYVISIDENRLWEYLEKAARNKTGRTTLGAFVVEVTREPLPPKGEL